MSDSKNTSPVGWYVATYVIRFIELSDPGNDDPEHTFLTWENTILVKAENLDEAYDKTISFAARETAPYKGGIEGVDVQWVFEGVLDLIPVYESSRTVPKSCGASARLGDSPTSEGTFAAGASFGNSGVTLSPYGHADRAGDAVSIFWSARAQPLLRRSGPATRISGSNAP